MQFIRIKTPTWLIGKNDYPRVIEKGRCLTALAKKRITEKKLNFVDISEGKKISA